MGMRSASPNTLFFFTRANWMGRLAGQICPHETINAVFFVGVFLIQEILI